MKIPPAFAYVFGWELVVTDKNSSYYNKIGIVDSISTLNNTQYQVKMSFDDMKDKEFTFDQLDIYEEFKRKLLKQLVATKNYLDSL